MSRPALAVEVTFNTPIEPHSDEEGLVPSRVEDAGLDRQATLITEDRETLYITVRDDGVSVEQFNKLKELLLDGWEPTSYIHGDIAHLDGALANAGPTGEPVNGIVDISLTFLNDTGRLYTSASTAAKNSSSA